MPLDGLYLFQGMAALRDKSESIKVAWKNDTYGNDISEEKHVKNIDSGGQGRIIPTDILSPILPSLRVSFRHPGVFDYSTLRLYSPTLITTMEYSRNYRLLRNWSVCSSTGSHYLVTPKSTECLENGPLSASTTFSASDRLDKSSRQPIGTVQNTQDPPKDPMEPSPSTDSQ